MWNQINSSSIHIFERKYLYTSGKAGFSAPKIRSMTNFTPTAASSNQMAKNIPKYIRIITACCQG